MLNWICPTGMGCECMIYVFMGENLHPTKAGICSAGQIGLHVLFRESQEHVLLSEEFLPIWIHAQGERGGARQN